MTALPIGLPPTNAKQGNRLSRGGRQRRSPQARSRRARWRRTRLLRVLCAVLAGIAVWLVTDTLRPPEPPTGDPVVVSVRDVPLGSTVSAADVGLERRPAQLRPVSALERVELVVGRVAAGPIAAGEILTPGRFQGASRLKGLVAGQLAVSVPLLESGILEALEPGDRVDLFAAINGQRVASAATVLGLPTARDAGGNGAAESSAHVVLGLTNEQAAAVAASISAPTGASGFLLAVRAR